MLSRGVSCIGAFSPRIKTAVFEGIEDSAADLWKARKWMLGQSDDEEKENAAKFTKPCGDGYCLLLCVGRMSPEKRIPLLVQALPPPPPEGGTRYTLCVVGDGPIGEEIEALHAPERGIIVRRGMVRQSRLRVLYKAADFLVSASHFETLGMTCLEVCFQLPLESECFQLKATFPLHFLFYKGQHLRYSSPCGTRVARISAPDLSRS